MIQSAIHKLVLCNTFPAERHHSAKGAMGVKYLPWVPEWAIMAGMRRNSSSFYIRLQATRAGERLSL